MTTPEVIGLHPVEGADDVSLIELIVRGSTGPFDLSAITQPQADTPESEWQVPYDEKILDDRGESIKADPWMVRDDSLWQGEVRLALFFHLLEPDAPLLTPFGEIELPPPSSRPQRLEFMEYQPP